MANTHSQTTASSQAIALMSSYDSLGGSPEWRSLLPTDISGIDAKIETAIHDTIDPSNQYEAGSIVKVTCDPKLAAGFTAELADVLIPAGLRTQWTGPRSLRSAATRPTSKTSAHFVVPTMSTALPLGTLVYASGCAVAADNGVKHCAASGTTTNVIITGGLTAETFSAAQNVSLEVCGFQFTSGDATITVSGSTITFGTTSKDLTELGLVAGQSVYVGDSASAAYSFATAASNGPARVVSVAAGALVLEMMHTTATTDAGTGKTIRLRFGQTCRAVARTSSDYLESWLQVETAVENLGASNATAYVYDENCAVSSLTISCPETALATISADLMASDATVTETQRTNASTPTSAKRTVAFNTGADISGRVFISSSGAAATGVVTAMNLIIDNQAERVYAHGSAGAAAIVFGKLKVRVELTVFLTESNILAAARNNTEVRANWWLRNSECAYAFDIPSARIESTTMDFAKNSVVKLTAPIMANKDGTWSTSLIVSKVPGCSALPARS